MTGTRGGDPWIVSAAFNWHDSSVAVARGADVQFVLEAERIFRIKHLRTSTAQMNALIQVALDEAGISPDDVAIWCGTAVRNDLLADQSTVSTEAEWRTATLLDRTVPFRCVNHHRCHAACFYGSEFEKAVVISCDGGGDEETHVPYLGDGATLTRLEPTELVRTFNAKLYDRASFHLYGKTIQEGKFMGLAGWGEVDPALAERISENVTDICTGPEDEAFARYEKIWPKRPFDPMNPAVQSFAATVQRVFEEFRIASVRDYDGLAENLVLVGGSGLNVVANTRILDETRFRRATVPPCCDDTGQALGALLDTIATELGVRPRVSYPYLGRGPRVTEPDPAELAALAADLARGKILVWHTDRAEIGPRALGHRSLLASPIDPRMKELVSEQIKHREAYRPVAPIVLEEAAPAWFATEYASPYMTFSVPATTRCLADAPAVVHVDGSARLQTVPRDGDPVLRALLREFQSLTGVPVLINTSLNGPGDPICDTVEDTFDWLQTVRAAGSLDHVTLAVNGRRQDLTAPAALDRRIGVD